MKKILFSITLFLTTLVFSQNVNASSFNVSIVGNNTFEKEITLYVQVNNLVDFNGACNGLCGFVGDLDYDTSKLELKSISALENFDLTQGKTLVLYKSTGVTSGKKILSMKFKNKSLTKNETTTIKLSNIIASDGDKDISTSNVSKTIKLVVKESINNKPDTNTTNKEEIKKSNNNYLSSITLSDGSIKFDKNTLTYDIIVDYETTGIEVKASAEDSKATITGNGTHNLNVGNNVIKITIKAEDKSERIYTLNINREKKEIVVEDDNEIIENETIEKENNYLIPIVVISLILIAGIAGFFVGKKINNK